MADMSQQAHLNNQAAAVSAHSLTRLQDPPPGQLGRSTPVHVGSLEDKLRLAASKGQTEKLQELLQAGAGFEPDRDGRTALHYAAQNGYSDTCKLLIEKGCDLDAQDAMGYTALLRASSNGLLDVVRICLEAGCKVDFADEHGNTALHEAAWHGFSKTIEHLIKYNANVFQTNKSGFTALHMAAQNGHNESTRVLLYGGCNTDVQNNYGDTALHTAARYGHAGVTRILISAKCKLNIQNKNGDTALHISAALKRRKISKILVESHIDVTLRNKQNETAADVARRKEHAEIVLIISSLSRPHSTGPRIHEPPVVQFKDDIELEDGPVVCAEDEPPLKSEKSGKESKFLFFFKKKKKDKDKDKGQTATQVKKPLAGKIQPVHSKPVPGFFSQYVPRPGVQYYRDLAGNIKKGPIGYTAVCQCGPALMHLEKTVHDTRDQLYDHIDASHQVLRDHIDLLDKRTAQQGHSLDILTRERIEAEHRACKSLLENRLKQERHHTQYVVESYGEGLQDQLQDWLEDRLASYGHCLDHHHDDSALPSRNLFSDIHIGPNGGRLFRSRSDETLSVSDYSGKGRKKQFYESRRAAMEQIRGWNVPSVARESSKRRARSKSKDDLGDERTRERNNNTGASNRNIAHTPVGGNVLVTTAEVHRKSQDRLADGASMAHKYESSAANVDPSNGQSGRDGRKTPNGIGTVPVSGRRTPVQAQGAIPKHHHQSTHYQPLSQRRSIIHQSHSHGNIAGDAGGTQGSSAASAANTSPYITATSTVHDRGVARSRTDDGNLHQRSRSASQRPNLDERGPLDINNMTLANPGGYEDPLIKDAQSTGRLDCTPLYGLQHSNPLYGTHLSVVGNYASPGAQPVNVEDRYRFRSRTRSTEAILDGGDLPRSNTRHPSIVSASGSQNVINSSNLQASGTHDRSGYVTDSGVGKNYSSFSKPTIDQDYTSGFSDFGRRNSDYTADPGVRNGNRISTAVNSNYQTKDVNLVYSSEYSSKSNAGVNLQNVPEGGGQTRTNFGHQETRSPYAPTVRYRVIPPFSNNNLPFTEASVNKDGASSVKLGLYRNAVNKAEDSIVIDKSANQSSSGLYSSIRFLDTKTNDFTQKGQALGNSFQQMEAKLPMARVESSLLKDKFPYRSTYGLYASSSKPSPEVKPNNPHLAQIDRNAVNKPEGNLANDSNFVSHKERLNDTVQNYSSASDCLNHAYTSSPVYTAKAKEDSTCSSNPDSGYSFRFPDSHNPSNYSSSGGYHSGERSGESGTPSSSFSTDRSISVGPPSSANSPCMQVGDNSDLDVYRHSGSYVSNYQTGNQTSYNSYRQSITSPYSQSGHPSGYKAKLDNPPQTTSSQKSNSGVPAASVPSGSNLQAHVQSWYQQKLMEAAERLRNNNQYSRPTGNTFSYNVPLRYDPVRGSDV